MTEQTAKAGFTAFAEAWNGRLAMLGITVAVATEIITGQGIVGQVSALFNF